MTRTPEAESFFRAVYAAVQEVPYGKVTSYGHIAVLIGTRGSTLLPYWIIIYCCGGLRSKLRIEGGIAG